MGKRVDLNCDMGESFGTYKLGSDEELMPYISSANIACLIDYWGGADSSPYNWL